MMEAYLVVARKFHVVKSGLSKLDVLGSPAMKGFCTCDSFVDLEGESLLASNSPAGTREQATGRVDVPGEKQIGAAAVAAAASCPPPKGHVIVTVSPGYGCYLCDVLNVVGIGLDRYRAGRTREQDCRTVKRACPNWMTTVCSDATTRKLTLSQESPPTPVVPKPSE